MRSMLCVLCPEWFGLSFINATSPLFVYGFDIFLFCFAKVSLTWGTLSNPFRKDSADSGFARHPQRTSSILAFPILLFKRVSRMSNPFFMCPCFHRNAGLPPLPQPSNKGKQPILSDGLLSFASGHRKSYKSAFLTSKRRWVQGGCRL